MGMVDFQLNYHLSRRSREAPLIRQEKKPRSSIASHSFSEALVSPQDAWHFELNFT